MTMQPRPDELAQVRAQLAAQQAEIATLRADMARLKRRHRLPSRLFPLTLVAVLVALLPLSLLAVHPFTDLTGGVHDANIDAIYNAGVTTGCVPNREYCPTANVTREEMASFLARLGGLGTNPPVARALTAQTATNAAQLGGLSWTGYAQVGNFNANYVNFPGNATFPQDSPTFTAAGTRGFLIVSASGQAAVADLIGVTVEVRFAGGGSVSRAFQVYTSEPASHKAFGGTSDLFGLIPGEMYTIRATPFTGTTLDANDAIIISLVEFP